MDSQIELFCLCFYRIFFYILQSLSEDYSVNEFQKSSYSTLETCHPKINTRFEISSTELRFIEFKRASRSIFKINVLSGIVIKIVLFRDEYFFSGQKYENQFRCKILRGYMIMGTGSTSRWFVLSTVYSSKISFRYDHIDR